LSETKSFELFHIKALEQKWSLLFFGQKSQNLFRLKLTLWVKKARAFAIDSVVTLGMTTLSVVTQHNFGECTKILHTHFSAHRRNTELLQISSALPEPTRYHFVSIKAPFSSLINQALPLIKKPNFSLSFCFNQCHLAMYK
jgi:hypothetical protein